MDEPPDAKDIVGSPEPRLGLKPDDEATINDILRLFSSVITNRVFLFSLLLPDSP